MISIKTRQKLKQLKYKLTDLWYFTMKPLAYLCDRLYKYKDYRNKTRHYSDNKIKKHLNKQIQRLMLYYINNKHNNNDFDLVDGEFHDFDNEYNGVYSVEDFFYYSGSWSVLYDKYLRKYKSYCGLSGKQLRDKWLNVILTLCIENSFNITEVTKEDIGLYKYDYNYDKVDKVYRIEYKEDIDDKKDK